MSKKNWLTKGQILLVGQITAQRTKLNLWECLLVKLGILSFVAPNNEHPPFFVDLIQTLEWVPLNQSVFLLAPFLPKSHDITWLKSHDITWLNLKYHVTWSSTVYETPSVQLQPPQMCLVKHAYFAPNRWILLSGGLSDWCQPPYCYRALLQRQQHHPQVAWWVQEQAHT